ncbi:outer membrane beta-barrel protein [Maribacter sp. ANRC-HE7]|uniref:Outer membrane beta-barrel protein n=1 Tax=Maribacter aquimaris TaxID=2737171 RepID=A0ABR7V0N2_9FLAO|nr:outer membrane beta-barrel protein [Maribacter aquimaris]MBD0778057.1 outer membrane beta-barrel protein [Maribacter aquimaris]
MKKTKLFFTTAMIAMLAITTQQLEAQDSKILAGGGLAYATDINSAAVFAKGVYLINDEWEASLGINYYFPKGEGAYEIKWLGFDLDAHYVFSKTDNLDFYGIAGINIMRVSIPGFDGYYEDYDFPYDEEPTASTGTISSTDTGINVGVGGRYKLSDNLFGLGEAKYAINNGGYLQLSAGMLYRF